MITQTDEQVVSVIPNVSLKAGFLGLKSRMHSMVFTNQRIILARFTMADGRELGRQTKAAGMRQSQGWDLLASKYLTMDPAEILAQHEANFAIPLPEVQGVKLKTETSGAMSDVESSSNVMVLKTTQKKYKFTLYGSKARAREALAAVSLNE